MSKFSELAGLPTTTHESGVTETAAPPVPPAPPEPVVEEYIPPVEAPPVEETPPAPPEYENPLDDMPVATEPEVPPVAEAFSPDDLQWMSKIKLEEIGRSLGIELDRRLSQPKLVKQLKEHIKNTQ
tara:strand:+ start:1690 stop:2067 length:378 start_codon:yes stop_codon:yes gene_type:complete